MTVAEKLKSWLDEIGADGLMYPVSFSPYYSKDELEDALSRHNCADLIPAYRHADGSYHTEKEFMNDPCPMCNDRCEEIHRTGCEIYSEYQSWLAHKEEAK